MKVIQFTKTEMGANAAPRWTGTSRTGVSHRCMARKPHVCGKHLARPLYMTKNLPARGTMSWSLMMFHVFGTCIWHDRRNHSRAVQGTRRDRCSPLNTRRQGQSTKRELSDSAEAAVAACHRWWNQMVEQLP